MLCVVGADSEQDIGEKGLDFTVKNEKGKVGPVSVSVCFWMSSHFWGGGIVYGWGFKLEGEISELL